MPVKNFYKTEYYKWMHIIIERYNTILLEWGVNLRDSDVCFAYKNRSLEDTI